MPEIAARAHVERIDGIVEQALTQAGVALVRPRRHRGDGGAGADRRRDGGTDDRQGAGAGERQAAHRGQSSGGACADRAADRGLSTFPFLLLLISGGHCQLLAVEGVGKFRRYGTTIDDAVGEAFDKTAKLLGLPYPGGPNIEKAGARRAIAKRFALPRPMRGRDGADFSFSGLKTAVRQIVRG